MKIDPRLLFGFAIGTLVLLTGCREETNGYGEEGVRAAERAGDELGRAGDELERDLEAAGMTDEERARAREAGAERESPRVREATFGDPENAPKLAKVVLQPIGASGVTGVVRFERSGDVMHVTGRIEGLTPGEHGFHVHEFGDLSDQETGESAGSHFAPHDSAHGLPEADEKHVGDLGNIVAGEDGVALVDMRVPHVQLHGEASILGRALVVHENADDGGQPTGNAGGRVAFGVVAIANPSASR